MLTFANKLQARWEKAEEKAPKESLSERDVHFSCCQLVDRGIDKGSRQRRSEQKDHLSVVEGAKRLLKITQKHFLSSWVHHPPHVRPLNPGTKGTDEKQ